MVRNGDVIRRARRTQIVVLVDLFSPQRPLTPNQVRTKECNTPYGEVEALGTLLGYSTANAGCCKVSARESLLSSHSAAESTGGFESEKAAHRKRHCANEGVTTTLHSTRATTLSSPERAALPLQSTGGKV